MGTSQLLSRPLGGEMGSSLSPPISKRPGKEEEAPVAEAGIPVPRSWSPGKPEPEQKVWVSFLRKPAGKSRASFSSVTVASASPAPPPPLVLPAGWLLTSALAYLRGAPHPPGSWPLSTGETGAGGAWAHLRPRTDVPDCTALNAARPGVATAAPIRLRALQFELLASGTTGGGCRHPGRQSTLSLGLRHFHQLNQTQGQAL